jgi:ribosome biogenesis SPOUT family RNA methylase Rps3
MPHPNLLHAVAATGAHLDLSDESYHPNLLLELMAIIVKSGGHLTVKGMHPNLMLQLAQIGKQQLTIKW